MDTTAVDRLAPISNPTIPVDDVKVHIHLMISINKLQESVEGGPFAIDGESGDLLPSQETMTYIQNAVQRFRMWLDYLTVSPCPEKEPIPPLDVLMIWHAYMLSPGVYYQDSGIEFPVLKTLGGMPWHKIVRHN
jgi:Glycine-rich domain-containing protein-like